jgi:hypothetical protein
VNELIKYLFGAGQPQAQPPTLGGLLGFGSTIGGAATGFPTLQKQAALARENQFQGGILSSPWHSGFLKQYGEAPDLNTPDYNYRAAWSAGLRPAPYAHDSNRYHWPSALPGGGSLKSENHPTMWMEQFMKQTGVDPNELGIKSPEQAIQFLQKR